MYEPKDWINGIRWVPFVNASGEEIPARAIMRPTGYANGAAEGPVLTMAKPNATAQRAYAVNSPEAVPIGAYGQCTFDNPVKILHDSGDGSPAFGEVWEVRSASWKLRKNASAAQGFVALGTADGVGLFARDLAGASSSSHLAMVATGLVSNVSAGLIGYSSINGGDAGDEVDFTAISGTGFSINGSNRVVIANAGQYLIGFVAYDITTDGDETVSEALVAIESISGVFQGGYKDAREFGGVPDIFLSASGILTFGTNDVVSVQCWHNNYPGSLDGNFAVALWALSIAHS